MTTRNRPFGLVSLLRPAMLFALALSGSVYSSEPAAGDWHPYSIDHDNSENTPVDVSFLLGPEPAGASGFVTEKDGHLVEGDGDRLRMWGVNLTGWTRGGTMVSGRPKKTVIIRLISLY